jgi:hypothetical protein
MTNNTPRNNRETLQREDVIEVLQSENPDRLSKLAYTLIDDDAIDLSQFFPKQTYLLDAVIGQLLRFADTWEKQDAAAGNPEARKVRINEFRGLALENMTRRQEYADARKLTPSQILTKEQEIFRETYGDWTGRAA